MADGNATPTCGARIIPLERLQCYQTCALRAGHAGDHDPNVTSPTGSHAATDLRYCCDCRAVTRFADPIHCVPCCWNCLKKAYPDWEFAEGMSEGRFDRERVYREAGIGND